MRKTEQVVMAESARSLFDSIPREDSLDLFTGEGVYLYPKGLDVESWLAPTMQGERGAWPYWHKAGLAKGLDNDSSKLNLSVSLSSMALVLVYVGLTPVPG